MTVFRAGDAMSATNGAKSGTHAGGARCCAAAASHVDGRAFGVLLRPPRIHGQAWPFTAAANWRLPAASSIAIFLFCMVFVDAAGVRAVGHLPRWVHWFFDRITDFGKSGWFLWPLGMLFLALAALPTGQADARVAAVLAAVMVRVGFLFLAIGVPGLFVAIVKRMIGRARPLVGGSLDPYLFAPFIWRAAYASLPSGHATTAFSVLVAFGSLWPRARTVLLDLCAADRGQPHGGDGALSERRPGRRPGGDRRVADGAALFRAAPPRLFGRAGRRPAPISRPVAAPDQSGCPRAIGLMSRA